MSADALASTTRTPFRPIRCVASCSFGDRLERGRASKSYGIEVARLAGLPPAVLATAREVLSRLERYELDVFTEADEFVAADRAASVIEPIALSAAATDTSATHTALDKAATRAGRRRAAAQASLFDLANEKVIDELRTASDTLTGDEARDLIRKLKNRLM